MAGWDPVAEVEEEVSVFVLLPPTYPVALPLVVLPMLPPSLLLSLWLLAQSPPLQAVATRVGMTWIVVIAVGLAVVGVAVETTTHWVEVAVGPWDTIFWTYIIVWEETGPIGEGAKELRVAWVVYDEVYAEV
jgi:hypothetical protein